jgi:hypothetical protein
MSSSWATDTSAGYNVQMKKVSINCDDDDDYYSDGDELSMAGGGPIMPLEYDDGNFYIQADAARRFKIYKLDYSLVGAGSVAVLRLQAVVAYVVLAVHDIDAGVSLRVTRAQFIIHILEDSPISGWMLATEVGTGKKFTYGLSILMPVRNLGG